MTTTPTLSPVQPHLLQSELGSSNLRLYAFSVCSLLSTQDKEHTLQFCEYLTNPSHRWWLSVRPLTRKQKRIPVSKEECTLLTLHWPSRNPETPTLLFGPTASPDNLSATVLPDDNLYPNTPIFVLQNKHGKLYNITFSSLFNLEISNLQHDCIPSFLYKILPDSTPLTPSWNSVGGGSRRLPSHDIDQWAATVSLQYSRTTKEPLNLTLTLCYEHPEHGKAPQILDFLNGMTTTNEQILDGLLRLKHAFSTFLQVSEHLCAQTKNYSLINQKISHNTITQGLKTTAISCSSPLNPSIQLRLTLRLDQHSSYIVPNRLVLGIQILGVAASSLGLPSTNLAPLVLDLHTPQALNPDTQLLFTKILPYFTNHHLNDLSC